MPSYARKSVFVVPECISRNSYSVATVGWKTPGELRRGVEDLRDNWNQLRNQIYGRSVQPRPDIPKEVQDLVTRNYDAFRKWYDYIRGAFLDEMFGLYQSEFQTQLRMYEETRKAVVESLKRLPTGEKLAAPSMQEYRDIPGISPWLLLCAAGIAAYFYFRFREK